MPPHDTAEPIVLGTFDFRTPPAGRRAEDREGLYGWLMDLCCLAALALFVTAAAIWCGGLAG